MIYRDLMASKQLSLGLTPDLFYLTVYHYIRAFHYAGFSCYPVVRRSLETVCKPKWHKGKKQLPFIYMEDFLSVPRPKNSPVLGFSDWYLRIHLAKRHKIGGDKARLLTDSARRSGAGAEMLGRRCCCAPGAGACARWARPPCPLVSPLPTNGGRRGRVSLFFHLTVCRSPSVSENSF